MSAGSLHVAYALLPEGWQRDVLLAWDQDGSLTRVQAGVAGSTAGIVLPGMPNLHSHAFQRGFAGLAEYRESHADSFWTWRELMYRFALSVSPGQLEAIALQLYIEMLAAGYTSVCEFHYLHHDPQGRPYPAPAELGLRLLNAARTAGIGITMLPVLYQHGSFGGQPPQDGQRRFLNTPDGLLRIADDLRRAGAAVGIAPHSLRAVDAGALEALVAATPVDAPIHLHVAEQQREVDDCIAWSGRRPVEWLFDHATVDARWCLIHATHLSDTERRMLAASGAVAGLCPSTEANLGDGVFDAAHYLAEGGAWGIGTDSHASIDAGGELRQLEYNQRLAAQRRNVLATERRPQVADRLWADAAAGGGRASGRPVGALAVGQQADLVVLDERGVLAGLSPADALACHVFGRSAVRDVWVGGVLRIVDGRHALADRALGGFVAARRDLLASS